MEKRKIILCPNPYRDKDMHVAAQSKAILDEAGFETVVCLPFQKEGYGADLGLPIGQLPQEVKRADLLIAFGGDGTILRCAKFLMGTDTKLLGINTGTLGFMAGLEADQLDKLKLLAEEKYEISERMTLDIAYHGEGCDIVRSALNEVSARSSSFSICDFEVHSYDYLVGKYRADGVLFSTPSGSTAYALSAGGPIIEPDLECIEMTLLCPHSLFSRATMFSAGKRLRLINNTSREEYMTVHVDGEHFVDLGRGSSIEIYRGEHNVKFVNLIGNSFHESLCRKLCRPIK